MRRSTLAALGLIVFAAARIASTYSTFSATTDEPMHLSAGLELLTQHRYTYQLENPPLPRVVFALAPWLAGVKFDPNIDYVEQMKRVYYSNGRYLQNLAITRAGNLVFFLIAAIATWLWARRELGELGGVIAVLIFTMQPIVLGYSGFVTHDAPAMAGTAVALLAFTWWLDRPTLARAALAGAAFGFSVVCKFSCIGYVPAACLAIYIVRRPKRPPLHHIPVAAIACIAVVFATYLGHIDLFVTGIRNLIGMNAEGMTTYLFGRVSERGFWWYFPAAIALKTTIATLALIVLGFLVARQRAFFEPLAAAIALLVAHAGASLLAHPDYMAYFNLFAAPDPSRSLIDSNLEWGQDVLRLSKVVREKSIERIGLSLHGQHDYDKLGFRNYRFVSPWSELHGWVAVGDHTYRIWRAYGEWRALRGRDYERVGRSIRLYHLP